ncbi:cell wall-associated NlpC family hydrolase [Dyadobacter sp. BE34]|uniref:Cell wall-associated NlpC family hydrolase n=1 Tax=Dyadobacter fermentans TaxID=94254 RepID=A0ABU1R4F7_9BACT|nr:MULTISPECIES: C40 family peptidase [Dyadobacter]MDR6808097.1 cell wall-associated NlpC family hydrolase [Dyadobacter fermentans]MDR7046087.1 cell wall-associated NlpC family hydrolase [Dyadobacter sp. BE242]MDR7200400.1 cell wall-associated NlpC family hydrolase [Dyadobacter sp. BE34]MDR7218360.1 cell wall-associated NlpC family hydrolase [Dyadobacter sp. BE31]MDR7266291.1 cell wall-associated NlpC family hydrolase [Dyadobacter sp. BE32]
MKKYLSQSLSCTIFIFLITTLLSCEVFRTTPERNTSSRGSSSRGRTSATRRPPARKPVAKAPVRKPSSNKPAPARTAATYSRPGDANTENVPQVVQIARTYTGTPYRSGGNDKQGIDCSGLICQVYSEMGVKVPRISWQQSEFGQEVGSVEEIKAGDWLFFVPEAGKEGYVSHAGIVTDVRGRDEIIFIHASTSRGVREDNLFSTYFKGRFVKAMRPF